MSWKQIEDKDTYIKCQITEFPEGYPSGRPTIFTCPKKYGNTPTCCGLYRCCPGAGPYGFATPGTVVLFTWISILVFIAAWTLLFFISLVFSAYSVVLALISSFIILCKILPADSFLNSLMNL